MKFWIVSPIHLATLRLGEGKLKGGMVYIEDRICRRLGAELRTGCCKLKVEMGDGEEIRWWIESIVQ